MLPRRLHGILAAAVLPMDRRFRIDLPAYRRYLRWLAAQGVHGIAVNVDTGEGPHLLESERIEVLKAARAAVGPRLTIVAGLSPSFTEQAVRSARAYKAAGADALLVFPPSAFRGAPQTGEGPVAYYRAVGEGARIPLILFQLQDALGGVEYPDAALLALARLPQVAAIKEATFRRDRFVRTVRLLKRSAPKVAILTGNDNFIYDSFRLGAEGALIGFGTLAAAEQVAMYEAHRLGLHRAAAALGRRIQRLADVIFAPPVRDYRVRLKEALRMTGVIPSAAIRPPLLPVSDAERRRIRAALRTAGLL